MIIERETDRPALKLTRKAENREGKWVIILPGESPATYNYPQYGNAGFWYGNINEAEEFDSFEEAQANLHEYGGSAVVAFAEIKLTIHF